MDSKETSKSKVASRDESPVVGLVKKIETSAALQRQQRKKQQRKKIKNFVRISQQMAAREGKYAIAMTLTFASDSDYSPKCMRTFTEKFRRWLKRRGHSLQYVWVLERQSRIHYHLILWLPRSIRIDFDLLSKWWPWGKTWSENCRSPHNWGSYMAKLEKPTTPFRKNTRMYGYGGLDAKAKTEWARVNLPLWLQRVLPKGEVATRVRGGWASVTTGAIYHSPYLWSPLGMLFLGASAMHDGSLSAESPHEKP